MKCPFLISHYSLQRSAAHIEDYVGRLYDLKYQYAALTDVNSVSGLPEFFQLIEEKNKKSEHKVTPVAGLRLILTDKTPITLLALNKSGYKSLIKLVSLIRTKDATSDEISLDHLGRWGKHLVCYCGGGHNDLQHIFETRFYRIPPEQSVYYVDPDAAIYQQLMICSLLGKTFDDKEALETGEYKEFFNGTDHSLKAEGYEITNLPVESYSLAEKPLVPAYRDSQNKPISNDVDYLKQLCRLGWTRLNINSKPIRDVYTARIKEELDTVCGYGLANYFLLVNDFIEFGRKNNQTCGLRGSAVGCLIFYLLGVTNIDPVHPDPLLGYDPHKSLLFSRFLNRGRFSEGRISLPDADIDMPPSFREKLREYIKNKYGTSNVGQITTFNKFKGANSIQEVFRILGLSHDVAIKITKLMVPEAKVQDDIEDSRQDNPKYNLINYCIDNLPEFKEFYNEYKYEIDLAMKWTNTIKNESKHAAGLVILNQPLTDLMPVRYDADSDGNIVNYKMQDVEYVGGVKMDLLGVAAYEKIDKILAMINASGGKV